MAKSRKETVALPPEFQRFLTSEALLQQAIAGLLSRMPNIDGVQILHGANEFGKDIIFRTRGAFGEPLPCACVVKKDQITGNVASNHGARTVLHQVEQALDTPYVDESGNKTYIHRVYVVTPRTISHLTMLSIEGALRS